MVEGPGVHRVAIAHRKLLLGQRFSASSPNGKFKDGAAAIDGQVLLRIEAHGKNIFYFFAPWNTNEGQAALDDLPDSVTLVHIHFGMSGSFRTFHVPGPEPRPATRLSLTSLKIGVVAHLSASVCNHGGMELYRTKVGCLGPDPLRQDGDKELFWASLQKSKKKIGAVLMDQSIIAGIGNIYRTELLFLVGVHPDQPAATLTRSTFEQIWSEAQRVLQIGVATGSIITVSKDEAGKPFSKLRKGEKRYIYNHRHCCRCDGMVQSWKLAQRTVHACGNCQPLLLLPSTSDPTKSCERPQDLEAQESFVAGLTKSSQGKSKSMGRQRRTVEHQALKDITTGGLLNFESREHDDILLQSLAPITPEKPVVAFEGTRKARKRKLVISNDELDS